MMVAGCSPQGTKSSSSSEDIGDSLELFSFSKFGYSIAYVYEITTADEISDQQLKAYGVNRVEQFKRIMGTDQVAVFVYFYHSGKNMPDISPSNLRASSQFEVTDFMYDGDHDSWDYIYMEPIIGSTQYVNCNVNPTELCKI